MASADNVLVQTGEGQCPGSCLVQFTSAGITADIQDGKGQFGFP